MNTKEGTVSVESRPGVKLDLPTLKPVRVNDRFGIAVEAMHGLLSASKKEVGKTDFDAIVDASFLVADKMLNYQAVEERLAREEEARLEKLNEITKAEDRTKLTQRNPG